MLGLQSEHFFSFFMEALIIFFITLFGMAFGSFFNVCIYRLPRKMSIAFPNSHCPNCNTPIKPYHNIPIFSYLFLRGKCHYCGAKIHWHYFLVEVITPLLFVVVYLRFGLSLLFIKYLIFVAVGLLIFFIDAFQKIIPDVLSLTLIAMGWAFSLLPGSDISLLESFLSAFLAFAVFLLTGYIFDKITKRESLGGGDIKLIAAIGSFLGALGTIFTILISSVTAIIILLLIRHDHRKVFPYGPFLIFAAFCYLLFGKLTFDFYLRLF